MGADSVGPPTSVYPTEAVNEQQQQQLPVAAATATAPVTTATALSLLGLAGEAN